jgi:uncharacterized protein (TIGR02145 family)
MATNYATSEISFTVSWTQSPHNDKIWVIVDYQKVSGVVKVCERRRAIITATPGITGDGTAETVVAQNGFWLHTGGLTTGSATITATLSFTDALDEFDWCAYAFDYPPEAKWQADGSYTLHGTPPFTVNSIRFPDNVSAVVLGTCLSSLSDATGNPEGIVPDDGLPTITAVSSSTICYNTPATLTATVIGAKKNSTTYKWNIGGAGSITHEPTIEIDNLTASTTYTVIAQNACGCTGFLSDTGRITVNSSLDAGSLAAYPYNTGYAVVGYDPELMVMNAVAASGGFEEQLVYQWRRYDASGSYATLNGTAENYDISNDAGLYSEPGTYTIKRYASEPTCNGDWVESSGQYTLHMTNGEQQQGGCTFTPPALVGTFSDFNPLSTSATYVTLTDDRDGHRYAVIKIGDYWVMAQNLNYQKGLTWEANAASPSTVAGRNLALLGHFWCPGSSVTSSRAGCEVWGAWYSWETAMMVDGKWTSGEQVSSDWVEPTSYGAFNTESANLNHARSENGDVTNGRGICPKNWHVPTWHEWTVIIDKISGCTSTSCGGRAIGYLPQLTNQECDNCLPEDRFVSRYETSYKICLHTYLANPEFPMPDLVILPPTYPNFRLLPATTRLAWSEIPSHTYAWILTSSTAYSDSSFLFDRIYDNPTGGNWYQDHVGRGAGTTVRCMRD